ncbi:MAG TPA: DNA repair protein RadA [Candidatus Dormibacteraeota bacterium]
MSALALPAASHRLRTRADYVCEHCGARVRKWAGRCPACGEWNCIAEAPSVTALEPGPGRGLSGPVALVEVAGDPVRGVPTGLREVDRVLGGGLVPASVVLLGGDPGVGKSTLALQLAAGASSVAARALYCTGEESLSQVGLRASRTGCGSAAIDLLAESDIDSLIAAIERSAPPLAVIDSIQTVVDAAVAGPPGSPSQVRSAVCRLVSAAKTTGVPLVLVGHVTKEGAIAGPRTLEHMVDVVLYLEGDRLGEQRLLRGVKNRFGSTGELGLLAMEASGLRELAAPHRAFLDQRSLVTSGNVLTITCDGARPLAVEVQGLAVPTHLAIPRRTCSGFDVNRCCLLLAVMEKRCSIPFGESDVFLNAAGGLRLSDPGVDLAVALALAGSRRDRALRPGWAVFGEVGLGGEVRPVSRDGARLKAAAAAGVGDAVVPEGTRVDEPHGPRLHEVATVRDALRHLA